ncbi:globin [Photobacterium alginatilyticum]|uniref:Globin n=1 Tax=Photobacterium alginatilyticum TaxID=1775171 RepID=A0ABW9YKM3_9GAMM|nr:globin [Photobacterium alginatilyticum]NBI54092.1 globin [Photobacterium alginatilyticum]
MDIHEVFNDSYARCNQHPHFFDIFYNLFCQKDDRFREMFANVDMQKQISMLKASIAIILLAPVSESARESVRFFGKRHGPQGIGVSPLDFETWLDCLMETVNQCDPSYTPEVDHAWRECFRLGLEIMKTECET